jgi:hypothetical protein
MLIRMENMKPHSKKSFHALTRIFLAAIAVLAFWTAQTTASGREPVPAAVLSKLDSQLVLVVKKSRAEASSDTAATQEPDVYKLRGRVLVDINGVFSRELSDQVATLGGQVVPDWGTTTNFRAWVPFAQLEVLAARADIKSLSAARPTITHRLKH